MASKTVDAMSCFTFLAENAPAWIKSLEGLELKLQKKEMDLARVPVPVVQKIKKTSSSESIRPSAADTSSPSTGMEIMSAPQAKDIQPTTLKSSPIAASRKRKTVSLASAASGMNKYQSRHHVTVYYDSHVQDVFDRLVRNMSAARGHLRKSRMAERVAILANMNEGEGDGDTPSSPSPPVPRGIRTAADTPSGFPRPYVPRNLRGSVHTASVKHLGVKGTANGQSPPALPDARDQADSALGKAQDFCEQGAHQFLRDGDCSEEIASTKGAVENALKISRDEIERLQKLEMERKSNKQQQLEKEHLTSCSEQLKLTEQAKAEGNVGTTRCGGQGTDFNDHPALMLDSSMELEIDDEEDSEGDDGLEDLSNPRSPPFRLMART